MTDAKEICLNSREKRLLRHIQRFGIWNEDKRVSTTSFNAIQRYGMLIGAVNKHFPAVTVPGTNIPECNSYTTVPDVDLYWRHQKLLAQEWRRTKRHDLVLLVAGGIVTLFVEHIGDIYVFLVKTLENW